MSINKIIRNIKVIICSILVTAFSFSIQSFNNEQNNIDSLKNLLNVHNHDSIKVNIYLKIGEILQKNNNDSILYWYNKALTLSDKYLINIDLTLLNKSLTNEQFEFFILKTQAITYIASYYSDKDYKTALKFYNKVYEIYNNLLHYVDTEEKKVRLNNRFAGYYGNVANIYAEQDMYNEAIDYYQKSLNISKKYNNIIGIERCYINLGNVYLYASKYSQSLDYYLKAIKIAETLSDKKIISLCNMNIGNIQNYLGSYDLALQYYKLSITAKQQLGDKAGIASTYVNIGAVYYKLNNLKSALFFFNESMKIFEELNDNMNLSKCYGNLGVIYRNMNDLSEALKYYLKSLEIKKQLSDNGGIALTLLNIGKLYFTLENYDLALKYSLQSIETSKKYGLIQNECDGYGSLADIYARKQNYSKAYEYHKLFKIINDSIFNTSNSKLIAEMESRYQSEKKQLQIDNLTKDKILKETELIRQKESVQNQRLIIYMFIIVLIIILGFSYILLRLFISKKRANKKLEQQNLEIKLKNNEIENQKIHIEEIHKEVTDSISYARRIQQAMLPALSVIARNEAQSDCFETRNDAQFETWNLKLETFVLFRPKDIVSGDFYWSSKVNEYLIYAIADCTGHGVPGAFMSMLGISFLNEIVRKKEITKANEILNELRKEIINALQQKGQPGEQKDGMDISLVAIKTQNPSEDLDNLQNSLQRREILVESKSNIQKIVAQTSDVFEVQWSGANNPLWIISNNKTLPEFQTMTELVENKEMPPFEKVASLVEVKPDKMPIAIYEKMDSFTNHELLLHSGDTIYLMSDGYEDQFGGANFKKFLSKNLKQLLVDNCKKSMNEQKEVLETTLINWIGEGEQIDDITILGIKI